MRRGVPKFGRQPGHPRPGLNGSRSLPAGSLPTAPSASAASAAPCSFQQEQALLSLPGVRSPSHAGTSESQQPPQKDRAAGVPKRTRASPASAHLRAARVTQHSTSWRSYFKPSWWIWPPEELLSSLLPSLLQHLFAGDAVAFGKGVAAPSVRVAARHGLAGGLGFVCHGEPRVVLENNPRHRRYRSSSFLS